MAQFAGVNYTVDGREPVTAEEFGVIGAHCANTEQYDAAAVFLGRAEELGDQEAMVRLGDLYLDGLLRCTRAPLEHALEHLTYASNLGHPYAQFRIAELYRTYYRDDATAARFYQACLANPRRASHTLGRLMTSVSEQQLGSIGFYQQLRRNQARRDAVNPPPPPTYNY
jgi:TPR repeat protein